jgi:hypothetical protein
MKKLALLLTLATTLGFFGCSKDGLSSSSKLVAGALTNYSSRTWKLKALSVNNQAQTMTPALLLYSKTYNSDFTWSDSDGYSGTFTVPSSKEIKEITNNAQVASLTTTYRIIGFTDTDLTVEYTFNADTFKFVFTR